MTCRTSSRASLISREWLPGLSRASPGVDPAFTRASPGTNRAYVSVVPGPFQGIVWRAVGVRTCKLILSIFYTLNEDKADTRKVAEAFVCIKGKTPWGTAH